MASDLYCAVDMGWLRLVGSLKLQFSLTEHHLFYLALLQKRPTILRSLQVLATPYRGRAREATESEFDGERLVLRSRYIYSLKSVLCFILSRKSKLATRPTRLLCQHRYNLFCAGEILRRSALYSFFAFAVIQL